MHQVSCEKHRTPVDPCPVCEHDKAVEARRASGVAALKAEADRVAASEVSK